jgi:hypothetical protein
MKTKKAGIPAIQRGCKDNSICIKNKILSYFLQGLKLTAREINCKTGSNDARKVISTLRKKGHKIIDTWKNGVKEYYLVPDNLQLTLNFGGGAL